MKNQPTEEKYEEVQIDIDDDVFMALAKIAHERDITFNQLCNEIIREQIEKAESEKEQSNG